MVYVDNRQDHASRSAKVAIGPGVTTRKIGGRVGVPWVQHTCGRCEWCARDKQLFCESSIGTGVQISGGHAEYMVAYADATMLLPDGLEYEQAAPIFCAGYTVWSGFRWAEPQPGDSVAVVGIGGLGHLAIQYAKAAGFKTVAISHSSDKDKLIRELGADEIVPIAAQNSTECYGIGQANAPKNFAAAPRASPRPKTQVTRSKQHLEEKLQGQPTIFSGNAT